MLFFIFTSCFLYFIFSFYFIFILSRISCVTNLKLEVLNILTWNPFNNLNWVFGWSFEFVMLKEEFSMKKNSIFLYSHLFIFGTVCVKVNKCKIIFPFLQLIHFYTASIWFFSLSTYYFEYNLATSCVPLTQLIWYGFHSLWDTVPIKRLIRILYCIYNLFCFFIYLGVNRMSSTHNYRD